MISIIEYTEGQRAVIKSAQGLKDFPKLKRELIGRMMGQKSIISSNISLEKARALRHGANKLGA